MIAKLKPHHVQKLEVFTVSYLMDSVDRLSVDTEQGVPVFGEVFLNLLRPPEAITMDHCYILVILKIDNVVH